MVKIIKIGTLGRVIGLGATIHHGENLSKSLYLVAYMFDIPKITMVKYPQIDSVGRTNQKISRKYHGEIPSNRFCGSRVGYEDSKVPW